MVCNAGEMSARWASWQQSISRPAPVCRRRLSGCAGWFLPYAHRCWRRWRRDRLYLRGLVAAPDSSIWRERRSQLETPEELGRAVGQELRVAAGEEFFAALAKS